MTFSDGGISLRSVLMSLSLNFKANLNGTVYVTLARSLSYNCQFRIQPERKEKKTLPSQCNLQPVCRQLLQPATSTVCITVIQKCRSLCSLCTYYSTLFTLALKLVSNRFTFNQTTSHYVVYMIQSALGAFTQSDRFKVLV